MDSIFGGFYARLMTSLGLVVVACGPGDGQSAGPTDSTANTPGDTTGVPTSGGSSGASTSGGSTGSSTSGTSTTSEGSGGASESGSSSTGEPACAEASPGLDQANMCFLLPAGSSDCAACDDAYCVYTEVQKKLGGDPAGCSYTVEVLCSLESNDPGVCCYSVAHSLFPDICAGRPFFVDGRACIAVPTPRGDWSDATRPALADLSEETRATLAALWAADAAMEHASIASFARFALQLLALGAPAALVEGAQQAMADEIAHARACYTLAGAYAGRPIGPGPLDMSGALGDADLFGMVSATIVEGCVGETLAALLAEVAAQTASDPAVRAVLRQIAEDEGRHAQLAWRFVQWALVQSPAAREAARVAFAVALCGPAEGPGWPEGADAAGMRAHGRLAPAEQAALFREALAGVLKPAAEALLGPSRPLVAAA